MIVVARKRNMVLAALIVLVVLGLPAVNFLFFSRAASGNLNYRVFVAGIGTIGVEKPGLPLLGLRPGRRRLNRNQR